MKLIHASWGCCHAHTLQYHSTSQNIECFWRCSGLDGKKKKKIKDFEPALGVAECLLDLICIEN